MPLEPGTEFTMTFGEWRYDAVIGNRQLVGPNVKPTPAPYPMQHFYQSDSRWKNKSLLGSTYTIGGWGCALCCATSVVSQADPDIDPYKLNALLLESHPAGNGLLLWEAVAALYTDVVYDGPANRWQDGDLIWVHIAADMERVKLELTCGPVIMQVDYKPGGKLNSHFVIAMGWNREGTDILLYDPVKGRETLLLQDYGVVGWELSRAIYGLRLLRLVSHRT